MQKLHHRSLSGIAQSQIETGDIYEGHGRNDEEFLVSVSHQLT